MSENTADANSSETVPQPIQIDAQKHHSAGSENMTESEQVDENQHSDTDAEIEPAPRVILKPRKARPFFGRHPWVFESAIAKVETADGAALPPGAAVELWSAKQEFIGHGLWNENSTIRVRLYSWTQSQPVTDEFLVQQIRQAIELRRQCFDLAASGLGCRLVFSEGDGLSGLTVDFYAGYLLVQFTSLALFLRKDVIVGALKNQLDAVGGCKGIWLRTEKGMREAEGLEAADGQISGEAPPRPLFIEEHGIQYGVDVQEGQKTGCYLDQRDNRHSASRYIRGKTLDAFCFSGGFGITAAVKNRKCSVLGIDSSESALTLAAANAELNGVADRCEYRRGDVRAELESLASAGELFDSVILDPPKMARSRGGLNRALKGYRRLNHAGINILKPGGIFVTCSCSGLVTPLDFRDAIADVARESGRTIQVLEQHGQPADHPISATCPESEYLKMLICRVL